MSHLVTGHHVENLLTLFEIMSIGLGSLGWILTNRRQALNNIDQSQHGITIAIEGGGGG